MKQGNSKTAFGALWCVYRKNASVHNREFSLTKDEFHELTKGNCWYCGKSPYQIKKAHKCKGYYFYNGIDRVDNNEGYTPRNCISCCSICNNMKRSLPGDVFISQIRRIGRNLGI